MQYKMRRRLPPDNRLDWRDPDMPAFEGRFCSPEEITKMAQIRLAYSDGLIASKHFPHYTNDPSYNWCDAAKKSKNNLK